MLRKYLVKSLAAAYSFNDAEHLDFKSVSNVSWINLTLAFFDQIAIPSSMKHEEV